jgi:hypothetical protein
MMGSQTLDLRSHSLGGSKGVVRPTKEQFKRLLIADAKGKVARHDELISSQRASASRLNVSASGYADAKGTYSIAGRDSHNRSH